MDEFCRFFSEARGKLEKSQILEVLSNEEKQEMFYTHVFDNELEKDYPLGIVAIKNLLKTVVSALEGANIEVHGGLYEKYIASLSDTSTHEWRHYDIRGKKLPLWTSSKTILQNGTTGLSAWPAAWALAEFSAENCGLFRNKKILELGSGLGVGGIMLSALTKPREITLTDVHSEVLELLEKNSTVTTRTTGVPSKVTELDWCSYEKVEEPEVVIGADLLYDPAVFPDLVKLLSRFSCPIYIAATIRNAATWNEFRKLCSDEKLEIIELEYDVTKGTLFHFDRNRKMRAKWRKKRVRRLKRKRRKMRARSK